jgi:hypothetical protein
MTMNDDQNNLVQFLSVAASNRVSQSEIDAGLDTLDAVFVRH